MKKPWCAPACHRLLREFLRHAPSMSVEHAVDTLAKTGEAVLRMVHTHDGAAAACMALAYGNARVSGLECSPAACFLVKELVARSAMRCEQRKRCEWAWRQCQIRQNSSQLGHVHQPYQFLPSLPSCAAPAMTLLPLRR